ncbi:MAG: PLP-dependent aminotransferase family protein [Pseudomonas sp.]|uniref:aminotransferase-like domain-containing protein n=1 Tax=Pseudomonas abieticivorans TaxID=2931382 RepID=UPI0020BE75CE|nr:PLP-dependent aminotransferase family protein [Pseudomonas sp. PIA16]MDE1166151.1 PLP-dependent aminotransferase family protein [Pseudomonas sp.]
MDRRPARGYAYQAVYRYLLSLIDAVEPGATLKLPSLRALARDLEVSIITVQSAYGLLENEGRVFCVAKSGYFTRAQSSQPCSSEKGDLYQRVAFNAIRADLRMLGRGQPFATLSQALLRQELQLWRQYPRVPEAPAQPCGELELRRLLAARYTRSTEQCWSAEQVYIAVDRRALLELLIEATGLGGGSVLVTSPACPQALQVLQHAGLRLVELPLCAVGRVDQDRLAQILAQGEVRMMMVDSAFNVPQGTLMPDLDKHCIVSLLDSHGVWLLENDSHGELCFQACTRFRDLANPDRLLVLSSFEHTLGGDAPFAYLLSRHFGADLRAAFVRRGFQVPLLRQRAIARLYAAGVVDEHLMRLRASLSLRLEQLSARVKRLLGEQVWVDRPAGGAALWLRARQPTDMGRVFERLLAQRIVIEPGEMFSVGGLHRHCLQLRCGGQDDPPPDAVLLALGKALSQAARPLKAEP